MLWISIVFTLIVVVSSWLYTSTITKTKFPRLRNKRICLLIAHPDDEAMFFAPTLLALTQPELGNHVKILCLSSGELPYYSDPSSKAADDAGEGDADGLGGTRKKELMKSGLLLGLRKEEDVFVVESSEFPDCMTATWSKEKISSLLSSAFARDLSKTAASRATEAPAATIDVLITFDSNGISSHPNHISLYHGARHFISSLLRNRPGWQSPVDLYTLTTVNIVRKYTSFFDALITLTLIAFQKRSAGAHPSPLLFMNGPGEVRTAQQAMTKAHISQMKWFRWGWIGISRYMVVNDLRVEKVS